MKVSKLLAILGQEATDQDRRAAYAFVADHPAWHPVVRALCAGQDDWDLRRLETEVIAPSELELAQGVVHFTKIAQVFFAANVSPRAKLPLHPSVQKKGDDEKKAIRASWEDDVLPKILEVTGKKQFPAAARAVVKEQGNYSAAVRWLQEQGVSGSFSLIRSKIVEAHQ